MAKEPGPLTRLSEAVRERQLSATTLVTESLRRLDAAQPSLNVAAELSYDDALETAGRVDPVSYTHL